MFISKAIIFITRNILLLISLPVSLFSMVYLYSVQTPFGTKRLSETLFDLIYAKLSFAPYSIPKLSLGMSSYYLLLNTLYTLPNTNLFQNRFHIFRQFGFEAHLFFFYRMKKPEHPRMQCLARHKLQ
jgi:hypothetical protein